jgi:hypothetical protein
MGLKREPGEKRKEKTLLANLNVYEYSVPRRTPGRNQVCCRVNAGPAQRDPDFDRMFPHIFPCSLFCFFRIVVCSSTSMQPRQGQGDNPHRAASSPVNQNEALHVPVGPPHGSWLQLFAVVPQPTFVPSWLASCGRYHGEELEKEEVGDAQPCQPLTVERRPIAYANASSSHTVCELATSMDHVHGGYGFGSAMERTGYPYSLPTLASLPAFAGTAIHHRLHHQLSLVG